DRLLVGRADASSGAAVGQAVAALAGCPLPVIAVLTGDNRPAAVLAAAACDLAICSAEGSYDLRAPGFPTAARRLLAERFGRAATGATALLDGGELRRSGLAMPIVAAAEVESFALETARSIAGASATALRELKGQLAVRTRQLADALVAAADLEE